MCLSSAESNVYTRCAPNTGVFDGMLAQSPNRLSAHAILFASITCVTATPLVRLGYAFAYCSLGSEVYVSCALRTGVFDGLKLPRGSQFASYIVARIPLALACPCIRRDLQMCACLTLAVRPCLSGRSVGRVRWSVRSVGQQVCMCTVGLHVYRSPRV